MFLRYHPVRFILLVALVALSACAPASKPGTVTLQLAVSDEQGNPSETYANEFADQVKTLSDGQITIKPTWNAGEKTEAGFEAGVIQLVKAGKADLGIAASRAWITQDIPSFQALQAPFLIDNDALAKAVATSDISAKMLEGLSQYGIVGLTLWPEDLRHPFSTLAGKPILSPADFPGRTIRVTSEVSKRLVEALGGQTMTGEGTYQGAESGLRQARSLSGTPTATANVTFFPKYQVLFANAAAFNKLSDAQKEILRKAAAAAQKKAIADYPGDAAAAQTWCSEVGAVVLASDEQIAAFQKAAKPVFDWIDQNPQNATLVAAIRELKTKTPASPAVQACGSDVAAQAPAPTQSADTQTWSTGLPPNGVYQVTLTGEDVMKMGVSKANAADWSGIFTNTFKDGVFHTTWEGTEGAAKGQTASCDGTYALVQDYTSIQLNSDCGNEVDNIRWRIDADGMHVHVIEILNGMATEVTAVLEAKPYQKIGE